MPLSPPPKPPPPAMAKAEGVPGSDFMVDVIKSLDIDYLPCIYAYLQSVSKPPEVNNISLLKP
jgi:hypothetical protein